MRSVKFSWFPVLIGVIITLLLARSIFVATKQKQMVKSSRYFDETAEWIPPSESEIPTDENGDLIRYGKDLIVNTARYLGPKGLVAVKSNGMNCQNCHLNAGRQNFANPFSAVTSTYPKFRHRSGKLESIEFRVNECMQRSLNGEPLDSLSTEMRAMVAYLKWIGEGIPKDFKPRGSAVEDIPYLERAANPSQGKAIYINKCEKCHGKNGEGFLLADGSSYLYPPLWGDSSYNVSAGMHRLSRLAGFVKNNMPFGVTRYNPELTDEQAWDVAAFIASQRRPDKRFAYDWPDISKKPVDYPFGPFADGLSEQQHKYGPFKESSKVKVESSK